MKALALLLCLAAQYQNPKPLETAVRLHAGNSWGSGTVVYSDSATSLILSCAHVFREAKGQQIVAEFWGRNRGLSCEAQLLSWDAEHDLALLVAAPGRQLPASRIVPRSWRPARPMRVYVVGCAEAQPPTLYVTAIVRPHVELDLIETAYTGIVANREPAQGRSGGGLFTTDYYVAGVCNFASRGTGMFADPDSIHALLDRQGLSQLYVHPQLDPGLRECQTQVRRRFGLFAGIVGRRGAIGAYMGPRPDTVTCPGGVCPAPQPTPVPSPVPIPDPTPIPVPNPQPAPVPTVDLTDIQRRLAILEARSLMPIRVGVTHPDGKTTKEDSFPDYHPNSAHQDNPQYRGRIGINLFAIPNPAPTPPGKP